MIKSINYQANRIASIEISDPEDINTLGDSYGYGSTARVTGQISAEYMYTPNGWISTSSNGGSGGVLVVHGTLDEQGRYTVAVDKTWAEIYAADVVVVISEATRGDDVMKIRECTVYTASYEGKYRLTIGSSSQHSDLVTDNPDGYPVAQGGN